MPAPGSVWASGTWDDNAWAANTWADAEEAADDPSFRFRGNAMNRRRYSGLFGLLLALLGGFTHGG